MITFPKQKKRKIILIKLLAYILLGFTAVSTAIADPKVEIGGAVEVELSAGDDYTGANSSDLALATVALGIDAEINDRVSGSLVVLHEDDDTEGFVIDEGFIAITGGEDSNWYVNAGRMYIPFGNFETNMVSDPLTLELAETQEAALQVGVEVNNFNASIYMFNGDADKTGIDEDVVDDFGISISYATSNLDVGIDFLNNVAETDGIWGILDGNGVTAVQDQTQGIAFHVIYSAGPIIVIAEIVSADQLEDLADKEPQATNIEVVYEMEGGTIALGVQNSEDAEGTLPERKVMLAYTTKIAKDVSLAVEYGDAEDYETETNESGATFTAQIAVEF